MKFLTYHWQNSSAAFHPIRLCISEHLSPLHPHSQGELELIYFYRTDGCAYRIGKNEFSAKEGALIAANPWELHSCADWGENARIACLIVDLAKLPCPVQNLRFSSFTPPSEKLKERFLSLESLLSSGKTGCALDLAMLSSVCDILSLLSESAAKQSETPHAFAPVLRYIEEHLSEPLRMGELAALMHLSEDRFYHLFKEQMGISPSDYLTSARIFRACALLCETDMTVAAVAGECGFCSSAYFSSVFKRYTSLSPVAYRKTS